MSRYKEHFTVSSHDVDNNNMLRPSMLVQFMQETANHQMRDRRPTYYELLNDGKAFVVTRFSMDVKQPPKMYDELVCETWSCPAKAATFIRSFRVLRGSEPCAEGYSEWALSDRKSGELVRTKEIDLSEYESEEPKKTLMPTRFRLPNDIEYEKVGKKKVFYSDVDLNMHMNNTRYSDMLWNYIPDVEKKIVRGVSIRFMAEAAYGSEIEIFRSNGKVDSAILSLENQAMSRDGKFFDYHLFRTTVNDKKNVDAIFKMEEL